MRPEVLPGLERFTRAVHAEGAAASIQLGHCGFFASPSVIGRRPLGASSKLCLFRLSYCAEMTEADIEEKTEDFVRAARLAREAGFDAVEIHAGHGYLLSQFISPVDQPAARPLRRVAWRTAYAFPRRCVQAGPRRGGTRLPHPGEDEPTGRDERRLGT